MEIDRLPERVLLAGDAHGNTHYIRRVLEVTADRAVEVVIFLGDFGVVFSGNDADERDLDLIEEWSEQLGIRALVIEGNHEGYSTLDRRYPRDAGGYRAVRPRITYLPRVWMALSPSGNVVACLAGASSIDYQSRRLPDTDGQHGTWWFDEQIREEEVALFEGIHVDVLLGHEAYDSSALRSALAPTQHFWPAEAQEYARRSRDLFNQAIRAANPSPRLTVGGHYHHWLDVSERITNDADVKSWLRSVVLTLEGERFSTAILNTNTLQLEFVDSKWKPRSRRAQQIIAEQLGDGDTEG